MTDAFPAGLQAIREAIRLSEGLQGARRIFYYEYRSVLAALLLATQETSQALTIYEENLAWANNQEFRSSAGSYAYNAAMVLVNAKEGNREKTLEYFEIAAQRAQDLNDPLKEANALAGKANFLFNQGRYQEAKDLLKNALILFKKINNPYRLYSTLVFLARCSLNLGQLQDAERYATEASPIIKTEFQQDKMHLYLVQYKVAKEKGNAVRALEYMEKFHDIYERIKDAQEESELQRLKTELGLQLEEERSAKLKEHLAAEETRNALLKRENEAQARELVLTERLRVIAVVLFVLLGITGITMVLAIRRGQAIQRAKAKIQAILDTIDEGLLTLDEKLLVKDGYSAYTKRIFPHETLVGQDIFAVLLNRARVSADRRDLWRETLLACMGADAIAWEMNEEHLPRELFLQEEGRTLSLFWQPMIKAGQIFSFILAFRDITSIKAMEESIANERNEMEKTQFRITEVLSRNVRESRRLIQDLGQILPLLGGIDRQSPEKVDLLRQLHTFKGAARSLGLQNLSGILHQLEDAVKNSAASGHDLTMELEKEQKAYQKVFDEILMVPEVSAGNRANLLAVIQDLLPDVDQRLKDHGLMLEAIEVSDLVMHWPTPLLQDLKSILLHAFTNAVDHGFLRPLQKGQAPGSARFKIRAWHWDQGIRLEFQDNGMGLDWPRLQALAESRGFQPEADQTLADVLFLDGVSTADHVNETSGRGLGLAAVRSICLDWKGDVRIDNCPEGRGTMLVLSLREHKNFQVQVTA